MKRAYNRKIGKEVSVKGSATVPYVELANAKLFTLTTAITTGVTTDSVGAVAGDFATTTNATGRGKLFTSNGTLWVDVGGQPLTQGVAVTDPAAIGAYSAVVNLSNPVTKTEGEAISAALATLRGDVNALRTVVVNLINSLEGAGAIAS